MKTVLRRTHTLGAVVVCAAVMHAPGASAAERQREVKPVDANRLETKAMFDLPSSVKDRSRLVPLNAPRAAMWSDDGGSISAAAVTVYRNDFSDLPNQQADTFYPPGARCVGGSSNNLICQSNAQCPGGNCVSDRMADDLTLADGGCDVASYTFQTYAQCATSDPACPAQSEVPYNVHAELWTGDPCVAGSAVIPGSQADFTDVPPRQQVDLTATLAAPVAAPGTVWLALTFSSDNAGWVQAGRAEVGTTGDFWQENNKDPIPGIINPPNGIGCLRLLFGGPNPKYAGFFAKVDCETAAPPTGACCNGQSCLEVTEAECTSGVWQGGFSKCSPSPCLTGACCSGSDFRTCSETTEAACSGALQIFTPGATCGEGPCQPGFKIYENNFETGIFGTIDSNTIWADQLVFGPGTPCDLLAYEVIMVAEGGAPAYNAATTIWTNNDGGTPTDLTDDVPLAALLDTRTTFANVSGDLTRQTLLAGPFEGVTLTGTMWLAIQANTNQAGPLLGGEATVGFSDDVFAVFNDSGSPGVWSNDFNFGGFNPTGCPGGQTCVPAGNFRINVWCRGDTPRGACCNSAAGTCVDGVIQSQCDGRWSQDKTCDDPEAFPTPCDQSACCTPFGCTDTTPSNCVGFGGSYIPGSFCAEITCPQDACIAATGSCATAHGTPGCDNALCCQAVCATDSSCCTLGVGWDQFCTERAAALCVIPPGNDHCADAEPITGETTFAFDTSSATTDGPPHPGCSALPDADQIADDVWFCWTASCTDEVHVQTCGLTDVDTKIAVYEGCAECPPTEANLLSCNDDFCGFDQQGLQSQVSFNAVAGQTYSIRVGAFPGGGAFGPAPGGPGAFKITCGVPNHPACPSTGDCCSELSGGGCGDQSCCDRVCLCDPYCCEVDWDANCAGTGAGSSGCGASLICNDICGEACTPGPVTFLDPPDGVVDAAQPFPPHAGTPRQGFDQVVVEAPAGADRPFCWEFCDTDAGTTNQIDAVLDNGDGTFTLVLAEPLAFNAATTITYVDALAGRQTATFLVHPGNVDGSGTAESADLAALAACLTGGLTCDPWECDTDRSGSCTPADLLRAADLLNGGAGFPANDGSTLPTSVGQCP